MWEVPALGVGSWENAAQVDTGNETHVLDALLTINGQPVVAAGCLALRRRSRLQRIGR
jgi:hypothetical protein